MPKEVSAHTTTTEQVTYLLWKIDHFFEILRLQDFSISGPEFIMPTQPETLWKTDILTSTIERKFFTEYNYIFQAKLLKFPKFEKKVEIKYELLFQKEDGTILKEFKGIEHSFNSSYTIQHLFAYTDSSYGHCPSISELVVDGGLTLKCCFRVVGCSTLRSVTTEASSENDLKCLSDNFRALHLSKILSDFIIVVKDKEIPVHKCILSSRSPVFAAMFKSDTLETLHNKLIVEDVDFNTMEAFTLYLYTGQLPQLSAERYSQLYVVSDKYAVEPLKKTCAHKLINFISVDNVCDVYALGHYHSDPVLTSAAKTYVSRNVSSILTSESWRKMTSQNQQLATEMLKASGIV